MEDFNTLLKERGEIVANYILNSRHLVNFCPDYIAEGAVEYVKRGGKRLRPFLVTLACELAGGDFSRSIPAAAAIEMSHVWTLVHDDIIDNDDLRRGDASMHVWYAQRNVDLVPDEETRGEYGKAMSLLVGDLQQAWAIAMLNDLKDVEDKVVREVINEFVSKWSPAVTEGQALDMEYAQRKFGTVTSKEILHMLSQKTASTYRLAGKIGVMIGLNGQSSNESLVDSIEEVCMNAGLAFQLRDDVLGMMGDEATLGKPIGSDLREGKKTVIIVRGYELGDVEQKKIILKAVGNKVISEEDIS